MGSRASRWLACAAIGLAVACATSAPARVTKEPTLTESISSQMAKHEAFGWSVRRALTWADFKGSPPRDSSAAAETAYTLFYGVHCVGSKFEFRVVAAFRPNDSWVRPTVVKSATDSPRALRHEQTHFDISEVHARRMRRYFAELVAPCRTSTNDLADAAQRFVSDERNAQAQYDTETDHSRSSAQQAKWDKEIDNQLIALNKFALPVTTRD
jgi:hypothetical protein